LWPITPRLAALWLGLSLTGPAAAAPGFPVAAEVTVEALEVFDEPDESSYVNGLLHQGERVVVRDDERNGWLAIDPPAGSVYWVEQSALDEPEAGARARVRKQGGLVRSGNTAARMPGPPRATLERGAPVTLLARAPLTLTVSDGQARTLRTWCAIAPPPGLRVFVRVDGVCQLGKAGAGATKEPSPTGPVPIRETQTTRTSFEPESAAALTSLPPEIAAEVAQIEAAHRAVLRDPVASWRLEPIRRRYEALLQRVAEPAAAPALRARLDLVVRQEAMAEDARTIETILDRSRRRDRELALYRRRLRDAERPSARPYIAEGMVQPSARRFNGQKVFALIGSQGETMAYLDLPAGLDPKPLVARRVGVRGSVHYNEDLLARLISVRDIEPLDVDR
jgi:hypothetical protein